MDIQVEIFLVDEEGILLRSHMDNANFFFYGELEDTESPLMLALQDYYEQDAPESLMSKGFETLHGMLLWHSELASPFGDDDHIEIGERLFLVDENDERIFDELAYDTLAQGKIPVGWELISR